MPATYLKLEALEQSLANQRLKQWAGRVRALATEKA